MTIKMAHEYETKAEIATRDVHQAAEKGQAATDQYGEALVAYDPVAERKLRLKIDLFIVPTVSLLYLFCFIDRSNIGNAKIAGLASDLHLEGNDYNAIISIFFISYIVFEIPATLACKAVGPGWFLPLTAVLFGATSIATAYVETMGQAAGVRFLLGVFEAGMMPGTAYYLSRWYLRRLPRPLPAIRRGILNPVTLTTAFIFLLNNITVQGLAFFAPTIVATLFRGSSTVRQQLLTVPPYVVGAFFTVFLPLLSWRLDRRQVFIVASAPMVMVGYAMFLATTEPKVRYGATFLIASSAFSFGALTNAHVAANVVGDTARGAAIAMNVMAANIGGLISSWAFLPFDAPDYHIGNGLNLATSGTILVLGTVMLLWMKRDNKKRGSKDVDAELRGLTQEQIEALDWKHPAFQWRY
ncbi:MFS general substrate transporter [Trichoderma longibrachiatum ATCC 18648]|uniref:MFS general substrate transporter n=1 Tax=Trichoderma longibrachiatum ATCC 18648 TaxID=983965 RepID=A0A2T4C6Z4_TRILO|nr:MFS general substrate transporter [Trichoderma longibrachiatum ATCC 18648]